jgi:hypothetical protein
MNRFDRALCHRNPGGLGSICNAEKFAQISREDCSGLKWHPHCVIRKARIGIERHET